MTFQFISHIYNNIMKFFFYIYSGSQHNIHMENHNGHGYVKKMNNSMVKKNLVSVKVISNRKKKKRREIQERCCSIYTLKSTACSLNAHNHDLLSFEVVLFHDCLGKIV